MVVAMMVALIVCIFSTPSAAQEPNSSDEPKPDLICHTSNPDECYPRIFQPTDEFQIVHEDQELPAGLHIRLNIWTGQKEAKVNVPGEADASLEGLPVGQDVVEVDAEAQPEARPEIPPGAPKYEPFGKIMEPPSGSAEFAEGLRALKAGVGEDGRAFDDALEVLDDLAHDIYYGVKIAEDTEAVESLLCLMSGQSAPATADGAVPRDRQAAQILASAVQHNPVALRALVAAWPRLLAESRCPGTGEPLRLSLYSSVEPSRNGEGAGAEQAAARVRSKVSAIKALLGDDFVRTNFLRGGGMASLLKVLVPEDEAWAGAQQRVGQLVLDTFFDEGMGAAPGDWPRLSKLTDEQCQTEEDGTAEGCWDYHVARIMKLSKAGEEDWSRLLHERLAAARKEQSNGRTHEDL
ncbi:Nucleotide exchange factor SIL1 [Metarhizium album ARSEF 1941]|uniref:Nucleotide exchange factor SIL1 n=1 Tax=Metarhizium album (strain ARSEF 1941) TaxID=1081103 RepID=A0A0B2WEZ9_METAS|nr:Nucleotide exchange factor SIL1 [Metarhizium album ARSEF 1941]KHN94461.1 Nucleotide exchange factor SIL1 [Metarhizium album ARSEF 1941]